MNDCNFLSHVVYAGAKILIFKQITTVGQSKSVAEKIVDIRYTEFGRDKFSGGGGG